MQIGGPRKQIKLKFCNDPLTHIFLSPSLGADIAWKSLPPHESLLYVAVSFNHLVLGLGPDRCGEPPAEVVNVCCTVFRAY